MPPVLELDNGDVWLNGGAGAVRIRGAALDRAARAHTHATSYEVFGSEDGFPGTAQQLRPLPTLIEATNGRLWFAGTTRIARIDPSLIRRNEIPPPVFIRALIAGSRRVSGRHPNPTTGGNGQNPDRLHRARSLGFRAHAIPLSDGKRRYGLGGCRHAPAGVLVEGRNRVKDLRSDGRAPWPGAGARESRRRVVARIWREVWYRHIGAKRPPDSLRGLRSGCRVCLYDGARCSADESR